jgi:hypothetical protein
MPTCVQARPHTVTVTGTYIGSRVVHSSEHRGRGRARSRRPRRRNPPGNAGRGTTRQMEAHCHWPGDGRRPCTASVRLLCHGHAAVRTFELGRAMSGSTPLPAGRSGSASGEGTTRGRSHNTPGRTERRFFLHAREKRSGVNREVQHVHLSEREHPADRPGAFGSRERSSSQPAGRGRLLRDQWWGPSVGVRTSTGPRRTNTPQPAA